MHKVVKGVDVFDVGRGQLLRFWQSDSPLYFHRYVECVYHTQGCLGLDKYVVVTLHAKFGTCDGRPAVCDLFASLDDALDFVADCYWCKSYDARVRDATVLADYEIWHVVDDADLWEKWESMKVCAACIAESDELLRGLGAGVRVYGNPYTWLDNYRCVWLELYVLGSNGCVLEYCQMPMEIVSQIANMLDAMTMHFILTDGSSVAWQLVMGIYNHRKGFTYEILKEYDPCGIGLEHE